MVKNIVFLRITNGVAWYYTVSDFAVGMEVVAPESQCLARLAKAEWNASELRFC